MSSLSDLVGVARTLHDEDLRSGVITAVTQLMAAATEPSAGRPILDHIQQWIALVQDALERAVAGSPLAPLIPSREAAYAISAMFLGIELLARLDPERSEAAALFDMMANVAQLIEQVGPVLAPLLPGLAPPGTSAP